MRKLVLPILLVCAAYSYGQTTDSSKVSDIQEITLTKKVFEKKSDRFVYDVSASPVAKGNTAFGLLKETPLVSSTDDTTLKILGKSNALIYMNGRKTNMSAEAITELLKNTPAENISKIEVITVPGSEYNVESSDGIINIILKKKLDDGISGNLRLSNTQSKTNQQSGAVSLNIRKNRLGISTSLSTRNRTHIEDLHLENGTPELDNSTKGYVKFPNQSFGGYVNLDYELADRQNIALSLNSYHNDGKGAQSDLFNKITRNGESKYSLTHIDANEKSSNNSANLNYELRTDDLGSKLNLNAAYLHFEKKQFTHNTTYRSNSLEETLDLQQEFKQRTPQKIDNYAATADYIQKFKNDFTASIGANYGRTKTDNDTYLENLDLSTGDYVMDPNQSNHFVYDETISGLYLTLEKQFSDRLSAKIGTRLEDTNAKGEVLGTDLTIDRKYTNILPYASASYGINANHNLSYSFSSRIKRPSFWELNPVRLYLTPTNYIQNNPFVKAAEVYNHELTYMYKNSYFLIIGHNLTKDDYSQVPLQSGEELRYIRTNYGDKTQSTVSLGMQKSYFKGIWTTNTSIGLQHAKVDAFLDTDPITGDKFDPFTIDTATNSIYFQTNNTLRLSSKKDWFLGVNFFHIGSQILNIGTLEPISSLDMNVKKIWNDWTFNLQVFDLLKTNVVKVKDLQSNGNYNNVTNNNFNQSIELSITYNFGNKKVKKVREIKDANTDAKSRTQ
ncbi:outer membrane beta-barrel family protein [Chryseobacterium sp. A301]